MAGSSDIKASVRERQLAWVLRVLDKTGEKVSVLAVNAGMADVTLSRFVKDTYKGNLSTLNVEKIRRYAGVPGPDDPWPEDENRSDAREVEADSTLPPVILAMAKAATSRNSLTAWRLATDALEAAGFRRGDVVLVDAALAPQAGDVVAAGLRNSTTGGSTVIFRVIEPPYLIGVGNDAATRTPVPINGNVNVIGPVTGLLRPTLLRS